MADWSAFATAFLGDTAKYINERKDKAEEYEDELREGMEAGRQAKQRREMLAGSALSIAKRLKREGATEELIRAAAASGPTGLADLDKNWSTAVSKFGANFAQSNPELVHEVAKTSLTAEQLGMVGDSKSTLDDYINQTYGNVAGTVGDYQAEDANFLDRLMGRNAKDRVRAKLDTELGGSGMSVYDLNQVAKQAEYKSLVPGADVSYGSPNVFTSADLEDETDLYRKQMAILADTPEFAAVDARTKTVRTRIAEIQADIDSDIVTEENQTELASMKKQLEDLSQQRAALLSDFMGDLISKRTGMYFGDSYLDTMSDTIDLISGVPGFSSSFRKPEEIIEAERETVDIDPTTGEPVTATSVETPEVTTSELGTESMTYPEVLGGTPFSIELDDAGERVIVTQAAAKSSNGQVVPAGTRIPVDVSAKLLERVSDGVPTAPVEPEVTPEQTGDFAGFTAEGIDEFASQFGVLPMTKEEYDGLSRSEKEALEVAISPLGEAVRNRYVAPTYRDSIKLRNEADPDAFYEVVLPQFAGKTQTFKVKGSNLAYIPEIRLAADMETAIIRGKVDKDSKLRTMTAPRLARKYGELPEEEEAPVSGAPLVSRRPKARPEATPEEPAEPVDPQDMREADAMSEAILKKSAMDIVGFMKDKLISKDSPVEEKLAALSEWADQNNTILPMDKGALLNGINLGLSLK